MSEIVKAESGNAVDDSVLRLVRSVPEQWSELEHDGLTAVEQEALRLLTAAGMVERRSSIRLSLIGHPVRIEVTAVMTGERGLVEAMDPVLRKAWDAWARFYREHRDGPEEQRPTFFCQKTASEMWRLTDQGVLARQDLEAGKSNTVLDFVQRRTAVFYRRVVPGHGRAERIETRREAAEPAQVEVTNLAEVSGPLKDIANVIQLGFEKMASGGVVRATDDKAQVSGLKDSDDLEFGQPQKDLYDSRVVNWLGKRLYLGKDTQVSAELQVTVLQVTRSSL